MIDLKKVETEEAKDMLPQAFRVREAGSTKAITVELDFNLASAEEYVARLRLPGGDVFYVDRDALISALSSKPLKKSRLYASGQ